MSQCSLIPKTFAQIASSAQTFCPSNGTKYTNCATASSAAFCSSAYMGSGYRSVAFGTWAVGDASRCFEGRRRGKSATALESGRTGRMMMMMKGEKDEDEQTKTRKEEEGRENGRRKGRREKEEEEDGHDDGRVKGRRKEEEDELTKGRESGRRTGRRREVEDGQDGRREQERRRNGRGEEEEKEDLTKKRRENGRRKGRRRGEEEEDGHYGRKAKGWEEKRDGRAAKSAYSPTASVDHRIPSTSFCSPRGRSLPHSFSAFCANLSPRRRRSFGDFCDKRRHTMNKVMTRSRQSADLYSSSEYVRHSSASGREAAICYENVAVSVPPEAFVCHSPASVHHFRNNGGECSLETLFMPSMRRCPAPLSPCPSRTSCPAVQQPLRRLIYQQHQQHKQWPLAVCQSPHQQPFSFIIDPLAKEMPRMRTKSLDNGLKVALGAAIRRRKDRICEGVPSPLEGSARDVLSSRKSALCERDQLSTGGAESRLEAAKNFLRRFYNQSTLRLTGRKRKRGNGTKKGDDQRKEPSRLYSSAMGPFFEMRKPQPDEMRFLPYNIHYTIESTDEASASEDEEAAANSAVVVRRPPPRPESPQSEWSCTPTCSSSATITTNSPNTVTNSSSGCRRVPPCHSNAANNCCQIANALDGGSLEICLHHHHHQQHQALISIGIAAGDASSSSAVAAAGLLPLGDVFSALNSYTNANSPPAAPSSPQQQFSPIRRRQQQTAESLPNETVATTPSAGYGSLKSSSDSSEGRRDNNCDNDRTLRRVGPAEKRFADWNELFQYLKREIVEMNVRDAQILRRLEGIQLELNGVRQMTAQQRR